MNQQNKSAIDALSVDDYEQMLSEAISLSGDDSGIISDELNNFISYNNTLSSSSSSSLSPAIMSE